jgi:hypothetical protein
MNFFKEEEIEEEEEEFFKEGSFGCIFRPGMNCLGETENLKYITKIQMNEDTSENEIQIGTFMETIIRKDIPFYEDMFAPIIKSCIIDNIGIIKKDIIQKCGIIQKYKNDATKKFVSNKIRYVGKYTLEPFLKLEINNNRQMFYKHFFQTYIYLLNSLTVLSNYNIIHYDLKQNNISIDKSKRIPIIIDFGLSFRFNDLITDFDYEKYFYIYYDKYSPWCLEIMIISFIVKEFKNAEELHESIRVSIRKDYIKNKQNKKNEKSQWKTSIINIKHLRDIINHFFENNYVILEIKNKTILEQSKKNWIQFVEKELQNKTGEFIVRFLMKSWKTWDNYSLSVIYFFLFRSFISKNTFIPFYDLLINNILSTPFDRDDCILSTTKFNIFIENI